MPASYVEAPNHGGDAFSGFAGEFSGMARHFQQDLEAAYHELLAMSGQVEEMISLSVRSLMQLDVDVATKVIDLDSEVDRIEVHIEEECLKMLALHGPVAADLRRLTTMMKINNDLERVADLACNIAERANSLATSERFEVPETIDRMAEKTIQMVHGALRAFVDFDVDCAKNVITQDSEVDRLNVEVINQLSLMMNESSSTTGHLHCFSASRLIEQIADHATSMAEDVIYMVSGEIVRHQHSMDTNTN